MTLRCECDHTRAEHEGGHIIYSDLRVENCKKCTCKHYRADSGTRKIKTEILLAACMVPVLVAGLGMVGFALSSFAVDSILADYTITTEYEYKKFQNGTEVPYEPPAPKDFVSFNVKMIIGFLIFVAVAFTGILYGAYQHEIRYRELIKQTAEQKTREADRQP